MNDEIEYLRNVYKSEDTSTWVNKLQMKSIIDYTDNLQTRWDSLREYIKNKDNWYYEIDCSGDKRYIFISINDVLDKMNELEGRDKE